MVGEKGHTDRAKNSACKAVLSQPAPTRYPESEIQGLYACSQTLTPAQRRLAAHWRALRSAAHSEWRPRYADA